MTSIFICCSGWLTASLPTVGEISRGYEMPIGLYRDRRWVAEGGAETRATGSCIV